MNDIHTHNNGVCVVIQRKYEFYQVFVMFHALCMLKYVNTEHILTMINIKCMLTQIDIYTCVHITIFFMFWSYMYFRYSNGRSTSHRKNLKILMLYFD